MDITTRVCTCRVSDEHKPLDTSEAKGAVAPVLFISDLMPRTPRPNLFLE